MLVAVPCSDDDSVLLLDADDGTERGRVGVGRHPVHLELIAGRVFVATMGDRAVSVIADGDVTRVETGVLGPSHFAVTADGTVLVPCTGGDALALIDGERLSLRGRVGVGSEPHDVAVVDGRAFVGSRTDGTVSVVDPGTATVESVHDVGSNARVQGIEAGIGGIYAVDQRNARLARVTEAGVEAAIAVGENPYDATLSDDRVLVPGRGDGTVSEVSTDLTEEETHAVGGTPTAVAIVDGVPWVTDRDSPLLRSLDGRSVDLPFPAFSATAVSDGSSDVVVSHYDDDAVSLVSVDTGATRWTTKTPARPFEPLLV